MRRKEKAPPAIRYSSAPSSETPVSIRSDLWKAFTSTNPKFKVRIYDKVEDDAKLLGNRPKAGKGRTSNQSRFITIKPISFAEQRKWAKHFTENIQARSPETVRDLKEILRQKKWFNKFRTRLDRDMKKEWRALRGQNILAWIKKWIDENSLAIDPQQESQPKDVVARQVASKVNIKIVRQQLVRAIEQMPLKELLTLKIPVKYLL